MLLLFLIFTAFVMYITGFCYVHITTSLIYHCFFTLNLGLLVTFDFFLHWFWKRNNSNNNSFSGPLARIFLNWYHKNIYSLSLWLLYDIFNCLFTVHNIFVSWSSNLSFSAILLRVFLACLKILHFPLLLHL